MYVTILSSDSRAHKHEVSKVIYLIKDTLKIDWGHHFNRVQWCKGVTLKLKSGKLPLFLVLSGIVLKSLR